MNLDGISEQVFTSLYIKAEASKNNKIKFKDEKAEDLLSKIPYDSSKIKLSKKEMEASLAKTLVLDEMVEDYIRLNEKSMVIHIGCGLDTMVDRINIGKTKWYYLDEAPIAELRKEILNPDAVVAKSPLDPSWTEDIVQGKVSVLIIIENKAMYYTEEELKQLLTIIKGAYSNITIFVESVPKGALKNSSEYKTSIYGKGYVKLDNDYSYVKHMNGTYGMKKLHWYYHFISMFTAWKYNTITSLHKN